VALTPTEILLGILVLLLLVVAIALWMRSRRSAALKSRFGPEYSRTVDEVGSERKAETLLAERQKRVASYTIKPLPPQMREHFTETWTRVQAQFVDDPNYAVTRADDLLGEVMAARGYPVKDFEQQAADLSVDHPHVVQNYRTAHDIANRHAAGDATTEDLRKAMIHYRALFEELTAEPGSATDPSLRHEISNRSSP
jgi:hypothetical protein